MIAQSRVHTANSHEEAPEYWIAYSDLLVSLLMVFALLLFLTLSKMQKDVKVAKGTVDANKAAVAQAVGELGTNDGVNVVFDPRTQALSIPEQVLFASGSATLRPEAQVAMKGLADGFLKRLLSNEKTVQRIESIVVEGHTDTVGTYLNNLELSQRRAQAVMAALDGYVDSSSAGRFRELLVASGRSEIEAQHTVRYGTYDAAKARRIIIRVRFRNDELLDQIFKRFATPAGK